MFEDRVGDETFEVTIMNGELCSLRELAEEVRPLMQIGNDLEGFGCVIKMQVFETI